jgi:putative chitinase
MSKLYAVADTWLKKLPEQSSELTANEKKYVAFGGIVEIKSYKDNGTHWEVTLPDDSIWYVFKEHVEIEGIQNTIEPLATAASEGTGISFSPAIAKVTVELIYNSCLSVTREKITEFLPAIHETMQFFEINTELRICHFLAQTLHESGEFLYQRELASGAEYDDRDDLGNTAAIDGDGEFWAGRGLIQVTGATNYRRLADYIKKPEILQHPELVEQIPLCVQSAGWFWHEGAYCDLNKYADQDDIQTITRKINGGLTNYAERLGYYQRLRANWGK